MPTPEILLDLASETGRRFAVLPPDFVQKMAKRIRRKFKVKMELDEIANLASGYAAIYVFAASALKECLLPVRGEYASLADIEDAKYMGKIAGQFPHEDAPILKEMAHWAVYYEYLR
jgi:hypothetical protein